MKDKPWRRKVRAVVIGVAREYRPALHWSIGSPVGNPDGAELAVSNGQTIVSIALNLRVVWREGKRGDFSTLTACIQQLMRDFYARVNTGRLVVGAFDAGESEQTQPDRADTRQADAID